MRNVTQSPIDSTWKVHSGMVMQFLRQLANDDQGQDMIEYTLLVAFIALASAAIYIGAGKQVHGIWTQANSTLVQANSAAS